MNGKSGNGTGHDVKRRRLLKIGGAIGVGGTLGGTVVLTALFPRKGHTASKHHRTPPQSNTPAAGLTKFVDELPIPDTLSPRSMLGGVPFYEVDMERFQKKLHRDMPPPRCGDTTGSFRPPCLTCAAATRSQ
jgi:hypothetical protein